MVGDAVVLADEGPQCFMAGDHVLEGCFQRREVERAFEVQHHGQVVGGGRAFEAVGEPEPALGEGQGNAVRTAAYCR